MTQTIANWPPTATVLQEMSVAYTEVDTRGIFRVANSAACLLFDRPLEELVGHDIWELMPLDEAHRSRTEFFRLIESGETPPIVRRVLYSGRGGFCAHELHRRIMRDTAGAIIGLSCVTFDVSDAEAAHREARQAKLWLESVVEAIPQALVVTDALGFVRLVNPAAELLTGWSAHELIGKQIEQGMPILGTTSASHTPLSFRIALTETWNGDVEFLNRNREANSVWLSASPIVDKESSYTNGVVIVMRAPRSRDKSESTVGLPSVTSIKR